MAQISHHGSSSYQFVAQSSGIRGLRLDKTYGQRGAINNTVPISWQPIDDMRTALNEALGPPPAPGYATGLGQGQPIKAIHIQELRNRITAAWNAYSTSGLSQYYDGGGLRAKKTESGATTWYLRSSVLGGQVVAEINGSGGWQRGYVYLGGQTVAVQQGGVFWMHEDPVTKSKRVTDAAGNIVSVIELDPWGGETTRSSNAAFQPQNFTSYIRDASHADEAMFRRYNRWWSRFDQPDPYDGSYNLTDPQSLNRYAYVQNDPVNFVDPSGLLMSAGGSCYVDGMPVNCSMAFALVNMGAGWVQGGPGYYLDGSVLVVNEYSPNRGNDGWYLSGQRVYLVPPQNPTPTQNPTPRDPSVLTGTVTNGPECDPDVIAAMRAAWQRAGIGTRDTEAGFIRYRGSDGTLGTANLPNTNQSKRISFRISEVIPSGARALAIFHTHPNSGSATPSTGDPPSDVATANSTGLPIYVISNRGLNVYYPPRGGTTRLRDGLDWQNPCN